MSKSSKIPENNSKTILITKTLLNKSINIRKFKIKSTFHWINLKFENISAMNAQLLKQRKFFPSLFSLHALSVSSKQREKNYIFSIYKFTSSRLSFGYSLSNSSKSSIIFFLHHLRNNQQRLKVSQFFFLIKWKLRKINNFPTEIEHKMISHSDGFFQSDLTSAQ